MVFRRPLPAAAALLALALPHAAPARDAAPWWNDAVFYQILVRSFQDSSTGPLAGDGHGDLQGLIDRLDYLNDGNPATATDLGVTGLWLLPMGQAGSDAGYSVIDYETVDAGYGTNADFRRFMQEAHRRGIRVIVDLVINHTSRDHAWFLAARDPKSFYHQFYVWSDTQPLTADGKPAPHWTKHENGKYLYAAFSPGIPDLNVENPIVKDKLFRIARYWLQDMGVDGFRLDAIKHMVEEGTITENSEGTHRWMREFQAYCKAVKPDCFIVGEVWSDTDSVARYKPDQVDMCFQFDLAGGMIDTARSGRPGTLAARQTHVRNSFAPLQYAPFLTNHDMPRVMELLERDPLRMRVAAALLLTAPGVPFVYCGEEVGVAGPDSQARTPMPWSAAANAGFTSGTPYRRLAPGWEKDNVATQTGDPASLLSTYRTLIRQRADLAPLRRGDYTALRVTPAPLMNFTYRLSSSPALVGYSVLEDGSVEFLFDPSLYQGATRGGTTLAADFRADAIQTVSVAGDFNGWAAGQWPLQRTSAGTYTLRREATSFTRDVHEFKFVVNGNQWMEPTAAMPDRKDAGVNGDSHNLVLRRVSQKNTDGAEALSDRLVFTFQPSRTQELLHRVTGRPAALASVPIRTVQAVGSMLGWDNAGIALQATPEGTWRGEWKRTGPAAEAGEFRYLINGEWWAVPAAGMANTHPAEEGSPLYAFLRTLSGREAVLCIINPSSSDQSDYTLFGGEPGRLDPTLTMARDVRTGAVLPAPAFDAEGLTPYRPLPAIPAHGWALVHLTPAKGSNP